MVCSRLIKARRISMWNRAILWSSPVLREIFLLPGIFFTWWVHGGCWRAHTTSLCSLGSSPGGQWWPDPENVALQQAERKPQSYSQDTKAKTLFEHCASKLQDTNPSLTLEDMPKHSHLWEGQKSSLEKWCPTLRWLLHGTGLQDPTHTPQIWQKQKEDLSEEAQRGKQLCGILCRGWREAAKDLSQAFGSALFCLFTPFLSPVVWNRNVAFTCFVC